MKYDRGAKGQKMELLLFKELCDYLEVRGISISSTWLTHRCRARGDKDFLGWDVAVLCRGNPASFTATYLWLVQVKKEYRPAIAKKLQKGVIGGNCYLAVYTKPPEKAKVAITLPYFWLIRIEQPSILPAGSFPGDSYN